MLEREFNKAKNNVVNLLMKESLLDNVKLSYLKRIKKEDIDPNLSIRELVKKETLKLDVKKSKLIELEYTKILLKKYLDDKHSYLTDIEKKIAINIGLKKIFKIKSMPDKSIELKEAILEYAKHIKTGTFYYTFSDCINNAKLKEAYGEDYDALIETFEMHDKRVKTNPEAIEDLLRGQRIVAENALIDLSQYEDISDYIVRAQYVLETPLQDDDRMAELIHKSDLAFIKAHKVNTNSGLVKLYALRDCISALNDTYKTEEDKYKYIAEYNNLVKAFNKLPKIIRK